MTSPSSSSPLESSPESDVVLTVPAESFLSSGFVRSIVPSQDLMAEAARLADALISIPAGARTRAKALLGRPHRGEAHAEAAYELEEFGTHWETQEMTSALRRFLAR